MPRRRIEEVIEEHAPRWMAMPGIVGVYEGREEDGTPVIVVMTRAGGMPTESELPDSAGGYRVVRENADDLRPMRGSGNDQG